MGAAPGWEWVDCVFPCVVPYSKDSPFTGAGHWLEDIPVEELEDTAAALMRVWQGPGRIVVDVFQLAKEQFKVAI